MASDAKLSPLDSLKAAFPVFIVKNKTSVPKSVALVGGEDVQVQPGRETPIKSSEIMQIPDAAFFKMVSPDIKAMIEHGVLQKKEKPAPTSPKGGKPTNPES